MIDEFDFLAEEFEEKANIHAPLSFQCYLPQKKIYIPISTLQYNITVQKAMYRVEMVSSYQNTLEQPTELELLLYTPEQTIVTSLAIKQGEQIIRGIVTEKNAARQQYQKGINKGQTMLYTEIDQNHPHILRMKIGNLIPKVNLDISIIYVSEYQVDLNNNQFLNIGPPNQNHLFEAIVESINYVNYTYKREITVHLQDNIEIFGCSHEIISMDAKCAKLINQCIVNESSDIQQDFKLIIRQQQEQALILTHTDKDDCINEKYCATIFLLPNTIKMEVLYYNFIFQDRDQTFIQMFLNQLLMRLKKDCYYNVYLPYQVFKEYQPLTQRSIQTIKLLHTGPEYTNEFSNNQVNLTYIGNYQSKIITLFKQNKNTRLYAIVDDVKKFKNYCTAYDKYSDYLLSYIDHSSHSYLTNFEIQTNINDAYSYIPNPQSVTLGNHQYFNCNILFPDQCQDQGIIKLSYTDTYENCKYRTNFQFDLKNSKQSDDMHKLAIAKQIQFIEEAISENHSKIDKLLLHTSVKKIRRKDIVDLSLRYQILSRQTAYLCKIQDHTDEIKAQFNLIKKKSNRLYQNALELDDESEESPYEEFRYAPPSVGDQQQISIKEKNSESEFKSSAPVQTTTKASKNVLQDSELSFKAYVQQALPRQFDQIQKEQTKNIPLSLNKKEQKKSNIEIEQFPKVEMEQVLRSKGSKSRGRSREKINRYESKLVSKEILQDQLYSPIKPAQAPISTSYNSNLPQMKKKANNLSLLDEEINAPHSKESMDTVHLITKQMKSDGTFKSSVLDIIKLDIAKPYSISWYLSEYKNLAAFLKTYNQQEIIQTPLLSAIINQEQIIEQPYEKIRTLTQVAFQPEQVNDAHQNIDEVSQFEQVDEFFDVDPDVYIPAPVQQQPILEQKKEAEIKNIQVHNQTQEFNQTLRLEDLLVQNTLPNLTQQELEKIKKLILVVEQEKYFSFCIKNIYQLDPIPVAEQLIEQIDGGQYFIRQDWKRDLKNGGLMFINETKVEAQKRVIKFMLKSIGSNLLSGKSILSISLPVEIFEIRSNVERFAYSFGFAPKYLEQGAKAQSAEEQMKTTLTFGMTSIIMYLSLEKPFNPILGETYQGMINGCPVYCEQISHHPPVCAFQMKGRGYCIDGHIESAASMHANSVTGKNIGYIRVTYYNTGAQQLFIQCPGSLSGTAFGQRMFNLSGKQFGIDIKNMIVGDLTFNPKVSMFGRKELLQDQYVGAIYKVKEAAIIRYQKEGYVKYSGLDLKQDVVQKLFDVSGVWNEHMIIDGQEVFNMSMLPHRMIGDPNPIPSDSNYRLDILHWKLKDFDNAQRTKELLEIRQRNDRKQREKLHDFYQKYRSLFEENEGMYKLQMGYDLPKAQVTNQQLSYAPLQPQVQQQPHYQFEHQRQQQKPTYTPPPIKESPARGVSQNQNRSDDQRIRKQVMHENIFQQPVQQPVQNQIPIYKQPSQQTYNVFQQERDILDSIVPQKQTKIKTQPPVELESHIHRVYTQRMSDLEMIKKRYVDQKQLTQQLDNTNPYKYALQKRVLTQMNPSRKNRLRDLLK